MSAQQGRSNEPPPPSFASMMPSLEEIEAGAPLPPIYLSSVFDLEPMSDPETTEAPNGRKIKPLPRKSKAVASKKELKDTKAEEKKGTESGSSMLVHEGDHVTDTSAPTLARKLEVSIENKEKLESQNSLKIEKEVDYDNKVGNDRMIETE